jgi:hypothetical protein
VPVIRVRFFNETSNFFDTFSKKYLNIKFHENPSSGNRVVPNGQTDGRSDMKLIFGFLTVLQARLKNITIEKHKIDKCPPENNSYA